MRLRLNINDSDAEKIIFKICSTTRLITNSVQNMPTRAQYTLHGRVWAQLKLSPLTGYSMFELDCRLTPRIQSVRELTLDRRMSEHQFAAYLSPRSLSCG